MVRAYFRIKERHSTCSKWASYLCNTKVDLILWKQQKFKALVTIGLNRLSSLRTPLWYIALFTNSHFFLEKFRHFFALFIFKKLTEILPLNCKTEFCKGLLNMIGQLRKFWFLEHPKRLFHHSKNIYFWKTYIQEGKT